MPKEWHTPAIQRNEEEGEMAAGEKVHPYLVVTRVGQSDQVILWDTLRIRVGRHPDQDLVLPESEISREHAIFKREGAQFAVEDLHTANHTYVNGQRITKSVITPNDVITIGDWKIRFCVSNENPARRMPNAKYASQLKDYHHAEDDDGARTMLGVNLEEDPALAKRSERPVYRAPDLRKKIDAEPPRPKIDLKNQGLEALDADNGLSFSNGLSGFDFVESAPTVPAIRSQSDAAAALSEAGAAQAALPQKVSPTAMPISASPQTPPPQIEMHDSVDDFEFGLEESSARSGSVAKAPAPASPVVTPSPPVAAPSEPMPSGDVTMIAIGAPKRRASRVTAAPVSAPTVPTRPSALPPSEKATDVSSTTSKSVDAQPMLHDVSMTLQLSGVSNELLQLLKTLQDRKLDLRDLSVVLQSIVLSQSDKK